MRASFRWILSSYSLALVGLLGCEATSPNVAGSEAIFFSCAKLNGDPGICRINPDRSGFRRLLLGGSSPTVSPDGGTIAYTCPQAHDGVFGAVCFMNPDGSNQRTIIDTIPSWYYPDWSANGRLAFQRHGEIWVANADGSGQVQLTQTERVSVTPAWSPDGRRIVFATSIIMEQLTGALWMMNADGSDLHQIVDMPGEESHPRWSPDGTKIAFSVYSVEYVNSYPISDIFIHDLTSQTTKQVTTFGTVMAPSWSPDGKRLVFTGRVSERSAQLFIMDSDGGPAHHLTVPLQASSVGPSVWAQLP